jgi:hypothetical protein
VDTDAHDLYRCRMGLLAVAILHWIALALMISEGHKAATWHYSRYAVRVATVGELVDR